MVEFDGKVVLKTKIEKAIGKMLSLQDSYINIQRLLLKHVHELEDKNKYEYRINWEEYNRVTNEYNEYIDKLGKAITNISREYSYNKKYENRLIEGIPVRKIREETRFQFNKELPNVCRLCGTNKDLIIHHKKYTGKLSKDDLMRLCRSCHSKLHEDIKRKNKAYTREYIPHPLKGSGDSKC